MDAVWLKLMVLLHSAGKIIDFILSPLNPLGPAAIILIVVIVTVAATKLLSKVYKTKRYIKLEKEFKYWFNLRNEALASQDREQGKAIAKNIDQAELNKVYYNYFFEGLLNSLLTKYLPIFTMLAYVNEAFKQENLMKVFGREYIFKFVNYDGKTLLIGSVFWFVISMLIVYCVWFCVEKLYHRTKKMEQQTA